MLTFTVETQKNAKVVTLRGAIDERGGDVLDDLVEVAGHGTPGKIVLDLGHVTNLNSVGARLWAEFTNKLRTIGPVELRHCSCYFIDFVNLVPAVLAGVTITSFYAPMKCPQCGESSVLLDMDTVGVTREFGKHNCSICKKSLTPLVSEDDYFDFITG